MLCIIGNILVSGYEYSGHAHDEKGNIMIIKIYTTSKVIICIMPFEHIS